MIEKNPKLQVKELLLALLKGEFQKASHSEMEGFAGCEGEGWIWTYQHGFVVIDFMKNSLIAQVFEIDGECDYAWQFDPEGGCFEQLN